MIKEILIHHDPIKKTFQGVLATYWYSAGIEDFSAADV